MTRKGECNWKSNSFVTVAEQVCLQPVLEHRQWRGWRNFAWQAIPHLCSSQGKTQWTPTCLHVTTNSGGEGCRSLLCQISKISNKQYNTRLTDYQVSQYQKGKTSLDITEASDCEWKWHQLGRMQVCTSLQTDNHASTQFFYRPDAVPAAQPTVSKHWRQHIYRTAKYTCLVNNLLPYWRYQ